MVNIHFLSFRTLGNIKRKEFEPFNDDLWSLLYSILLYTEYSQEIFCTSERCERSKIKSFRLQNMIFKVPGRYPFMSVI